MYSSSYMPRANWSAMSSFIHYICFFIPCFYCSNLSCINQQLLASFIGLAWWKKSCLAKVPPPLNFFSGNNLESNFFWRYSPYFFIPCDTLDHVHLGCSHWRVNYHKFYCQNWFIVNIAGTSIPCSLPPWQACMDGRSPPQHSAWRWWWRGCLPIGRCSCLCFDWQVGWAGQTVDWWQPQGVGGPSKDPRLGRRSECDQIWGNTCESLSKAREISYK